MYKQGKYKYKSQKAYEKLLIKLILLFLICLFFLFKLKENIHIFIYLFSVLTCCIMILHLKFRLMFSRGLIKKYIFNEI